MESQSRNGQQRDKPAPGRSSRGRMDPQQEQGAHPFSSMLQLSRDVDRLWDSFFGRSFASPGRLLGNWPFESGREGGGAMLWTPRIDVRHAEDAVFVHADLPGCRKEDVRIESTQEGIAISGERSQAREEGEAGKGYRLTERSYGSFYRNIPLPEGAQVEEAKARMSDGVLEIRIPLKQEQRRQIQID